MSHELKLDASLRKRRWKVKIRDNERVEPPHVSILWKTNTWRYGLREMDFLDRQPDPTGVPEAVVDAIRQSRTSLCDG